MAREKDECVAVVLVVTRYEEQEEKESSRCRRRRRLHSKSERERLRFFEILLCEPHFPPTVLEMAGLGSVR